MRKDENMSKTAKELEKYMRRIEVKKLWKQKNPSISLSEMSSLSLNFMAHAMESADYRFLNTALKINDRLRENIHQTTKIKEIDQYEHHCIETIKKRLGLKL